MSEAFSYDTVPYPGRAFAQTHPDRLATMAALFGLDAPPPGACRVLELGCGDGGNLLPMALALPGSAFVGVDLSVPAIEQARAIASELSLENVRFEARGFDDYEVPAGSADYVIAHGVYSWLDEPLRERLMALCGRALSSRGVAYVSYNAMPGHGTRQILRAMLACGGVGLVEDPVQRLAAARALLAEAASIWPAGEGLETTFGAQARMLATHSDALLFHDTLAAVNHAPYFAQFAAHAGRHGLQYLAEAEFTEMQTRALPTALQQRLSAIDDVVRREQLLDFLKQRMFRQTLLCRDEIVLDRSPSPRRIAAMAVAGSIASEASGAPDGDGGVTFTGSAGATLTTELPALVAALRRIGERWPASEWIADLAGDDPAQLDTLCETLLLGFAASLVRLHVHPPAVSPVAGARPCASPLARRQARERGLLTTLRHTSIHFEDDVGRRLLELLDGTRDRAALVAELAASGPAAAGDPTTLAGDVERALVMLARFALLLPDRTPARR